MREKLSHGYVNLNSCKFTASPLTPVTGGYGISGPCAISMVRRCRAGSVAGLACKRRPASPFGSVGGGFLAQAGQAGFNALDFAPNTVMLQRHILLIDDHELLRAGLRMVLASGFKDLTVHEAATLAQATALTVTPDAVLLDVELPDISGLDGIPLLRARWPAAPIVMLTSHTGGNLEHEALARGAAAFVSKAEPLETIVGIITDVLCGRTPRSTAADGAASEAPQLTPRQREVLELLCTGLSNRLIAQRLSLTENTVRWHVQAVLGFLNVSSRTEAAFVARQRGLVE
jgi:DNA-binding NarL/FixJ family response regulator